MNRFTRAAQFFSFGITAIKNGWNEIAAFQLHQATETYYKCAILVLTAYWPKQHNIATLGNQCAGLSPAFRDIFPLATPDDERRFELLKEAYVKARYSLTYTISRDDLEALARHISVLHERTEAACKEYIASMPPPRPSPRDGWRFVNCPAVLIGTMAAIPSDLDTLGRRTRDRADHHVHSWLSGWPT